MQSGSLARRSIQVPFINDVINENRAQLQAADNAASTSASTSPVASSVAYPSRYTFDTTAVRTLLEQKIAGQAAVIDSLCQQLAVIKADIVDGERPLYVSLFIGDTGVGKTEIVRVLAQAIHGDANAFCRIDMNTLSQSHYSAAITGAPPGYVSSKEGTTLFDEKHIAGSYSRPGIVLFDEVEKASPEVARALMNVLDTGKLTLASGNRELSFRNCLIFMTSNIGSRLSHQGRHQARRKSRSNWLQRSVALLRRVDHKRGAIIVDALERHFDPEFLNRIDKVELFEALAPQHMATIVELETALTNRKLATQGVTLQLDNEAVQLVARHGFSPLYGARAIKRCYRQLVIVPLAQALLNRPDPSATPVIYRGMVRENHIVFTPCLSAPEQSPAHSSTQSATPRNTRISTDTPRR